MTRLQRISYVWRRFCLVDHRRRMLSIEAALLLLTARIALIVIPFSRLAPHLGDVVDPAAARVHQDQMPTPADAETAAMISWAVTKAAGYVPFNAVCLPQAMAARSMLKRRGIRSVLHLGAAKGEDKPFGTHAWLDAAGIEVTGYPGAKTFVEIGCFI